MARGLQANVVCVESDWSEGVNTRAVIEAIKQHNPRLVTIVHCETPSGVLNPLDGIGNAIASHTTNCLFLVDFVASALGCDLSVEDEKIDLGLFAPQKVLSGPPALACATVSKKAWNRVSFWELKSSFCPLYV